MNKKAVEPLIAAVLLIVVTVGIGALVVGIGRNIVTENKQSMEQKSDLISCSRDVDVAFMTIDRVPQICKGASYFHTVIENSGSAIDAFQVIVSGDNGVYTNSTIPDSGVAVGGMKELNVSFNAAQTGTALQVKFVPMLKASGGTGYSYCMDVALKAEVWEDC